MTIVLSLLVALFGIIIGSFLNVCIYRIPRGQDYTYSDEEWERLKGIIPTPPSFFTPTRSHCPNCNNQLLWWHNIPVLSWLFLQAKCYFCKEKISAIYPFIELLTGVAAIGSYLFFGVTISALIVFIFLCSLIVITFIDLKYMIIPDVISIPGTLLGIALSTLTQFGITLQFPLVSSLTESLIGVLCGAGILYVVAASYKYIKGIDGLGLGDVKLLGVVGALFGITGSFWTIFLGSIFGLCYAVVRTICMRVSIREPFPFGPFLALGTVVYIFYLSQHLVLTLGIQQ
jgi:leader peptidase (prepilin peptidase) / N-methyltransferase